MISRETFYFLQQIAIHNNKPWFEKNRHLYDKARSEYLVFITKLTEGIRRIESIPEKDPARYIMRIYRDIRFSKDKTPYKKFFGSIIERGPETVNCPLYIQIQPGKSMMGGGVWDPNPEALKKIRQEIDYNPGGLKKIIHSPEFLRQFGKISGDRLARPPKGYAADNPNIELLKFKQWFVQSNLEDELVLSKSLIPAILISYKAALPFFRYFDTAMGEAT